MSENDYDVLPPGFERRTTQEVTVVPTAPPYAKNYTMLFPDEIPPSDFKEPGDDRLYIDSLFYGNVANVVDAIELSGDSPLGPAFAEYRQLALNTPVYYYAGRTLIQNCARAILILERSVKAGFVSEDSFPEKCQELEQIIKITRSILESVPKDIDINEFPESFIPVTRALAKLVYNTGIHKHMVFGTRHLPLVLHPILDWSMESLQISLAEGKISCYNEETQEVAFDHCFHALWRINEHLFVYTNNWAEKATAFIKIINEFRRVFARHLGLLRFACRWISITLIGKRWREELIDLCPYLEQLVTRVYIETDPTHKWGVDYEALKTADTADAATLDKWWQLNLASAAQYKCMNPRTCEALRSFPQWAHMERHIIGDVDGVLAAAQEAWKMIQAAAPGTYEHNALMYALYELRRNLLPSLEEWEFIESEIRLQNYIGEGGSASVHLCEWLGGQAAIKVFKKGDTGGGSGTTILATRDFDNYLHLREREVWFRLSHPHILPFLGACLLGTTPMILMPVAVHGNARSYRAENPGADWTKILTQVCSGVEYLHDTAGIVHGDIKGNNILMGASARPMIADFGLAKMTENIYGRNNLLGGTVQWMAPELLSGRGLLMFESDVYALGMTIYELWFDKDPFDLMEPDLVVEMVVDEHFSPTREEIPQISDEMWDLLAGCWMEDCAARPQAKSVHGMMSSFNAFKILEHEEPPDEITPSYIVNPIDPDIDDPDSIENLDCTVLHEPVSFPTRADFPFVSAGHLISFAVRPQVAIYSGTNPPTAWVHLDTSQDGIQVVRDVEHPLVTAIFRVQTKTRRDTALPKDSPTDTVQRLFFLDQRRSQPEERESVIGQPGRIQAVLMRRSAGQEWETVTEALEYLWDCSERCNSTVTHVCTLGRNSLVARHALPGDKVGLQVVVDVGYTLTIENAEIELHAQFERP